MPQILRRATDTNAPAVTTEAKVTQEITVIRWPEFRGVRADGDTETATHPSATPEILSDTARANSAGSAQLRKHIGNRRPAQEIRYLQIVIELGLDAAAQL